MTRAQDVVSWEMQLQPTQFRACDVFILCCVHETRRVIAAIKDLYTANPFGAQQACALMGVSTFNIRHYRGSRGSIECMYSHGSVWKIDVHGMISRSGISVDVILFSASR